MSEIVPARTVGNSTAMANLARVCDVAPDEVYSVLTKMVMPNASGAEIIAFAMVCAELRLSPLRREVYAMKNRSGQFAAIVSIDGWLRLINENPQYDGMEIEFEDNPNTGKPYSCTVRMHHKKRSHPIVVTEFYDEVRRNTEPWTQHPRRMLRHRTIIQAARVAFGFAGVLDPDEVDGLETVPATPAATAALSPTGRLNARLAAARQQPAERPPIVDAEVQPDPEPEPTPDTNPADSLTSADLDDLTDPEPLLSKEPAKRRNRH